MKRALVFVLLSMFPFVSQAKSSCVAVYALNDFSHRAFNQQIDALAPHLKRKSVALIDLNKWQTAGQHIRVSGREKRMLRDVYEFDREREQAVVLDKNGYIIERFEDAVDLVELLLNCEANVLNQKAAQPQVVPPNVIKILER